MATVVGALLTVWIAPAFTRQWDDRQAVRELKAEIADQMVTSAARAIAAGVPLAEGHDGYETARDTWTEAHLKVRVRVAAYFGDEAVDRWNNVSHHVEAFLAACDSVTRIREDSTRLYARLDFAYMRERIANDLELTSLSYAEADQVGTALMSSDRNVRAGGLAQAKNSTLAEVEGEADEVLRAHPSGFSTSRGNLLRNLLP